MLEKIGNGDFEQRLNEDPKDELGTMATVINGMAGRIGSLLKSIEEKNKTLTELNLSLEDKVQERTKAIRTILDHVSFGLLICDEKMRVKEGYSNSAAQILNAEGDIAGQSLVDLLHLDVRSAENFRLIYDQIFDKDFLLGDLSVDQLPVRFQLGSVTVGVTGSVVKDKNGESSGVLFCIADISNLAAAEDEVERNRALVKMISNRDAFRQFAIDAKQGFDRIYDAFSHTPHSQSIRLDLHTLKGNLGVFGLTKLASQVHHVEDLTEVTPESVKSVEAAFIKFLVENEALLGIEYGAGNEETFTIPAHLIQRTESQISHVANPVDAKNVFLNFFHQIKLKQARTILGPIQDSFAALAARLGKSATLRVEGATTLIPAGLTGVFKVLSHLLRNSLDHGIESPDQRGSKPTQASVVLTIRSDDENLTIQLQDDGRGIQSDMLVKIAVQKGLIKENVAKNLSEVDKINLVFLNGLSSQADVSDVSGRGVGMAAVKSAVEELNGSISIKSYTGQGTTFTIKVPLRSMALKNVA